MTFTKEQKKEAYQKLSPEVQDFVMDNDTTELISNFLIQTGLTQEQVSISDGEILYALFGLQTLQTAIENISKTSNKSISQLTQLKKDLEENIFSKIKALSVSSKENFVTKLEENKSKAEAVRNSKSDREIKDRLIILSPNIQLFINEGTWKENTVKIARQFNLKPEQTTALENEVFLTLLCFEPTSDFKENIKKELNLDENAGRRIADSINGSVFGQIMGEIKNAWAPTNAQAQPAEVKPIENKNVVETEETLPELDISMIEKAMQGAKTAPAPSNLPTAEMHGLKGEGDPYREPI